MCYLTRRLILADAYFIALLAFGRLQND